jgi:hypothetical protein
MVRYLAEPRNILAEPRLGITGTLGCLCFLNRVCRQDSPLCCKNINNELKLTLFKNLMLSQKRSWVQTLTQYTGWMLAMMKAITLQKIENKGSKMGHTKKILKTKQK